MSDHFAKANPALLDELFSRDPMSYADADLDAMADALIAQRAAWEQGRQNRRTAKAEGGTPTRTPKAKPAVLSVDKLRDMLKGSL